MRDELNSHSSHCGHHSDWTSHDVVICQCALPYRHQIHCWIAVESRATHRGIVVVAAVCNPCTEKVLRSEMTCSDTDRIIYRTSAQNDHCGSESTLNWIWCITVRKGIVKRATRAEDRKQLKVGSHRCYNLSNAFNLSRDIFVWDCDPSEGADSDTVALLESRAFHIMESRKITREDPARHPYPQPRIPWMGSYQSKVAECCMARIGL